MYEYERVHKHHRKKRAEKSVCYGELGCYSDSGPFGYLDMLPQSPAEIGTKFFFYSTKNRSDRALLELPYLNMTRLWRTLNDVRTDNSTISDAVNADNVTMELNKNALALDAFEGLDKMSVRVIVHGFGAACHHVWIYEMRTALMAVVSLNGFELIRNFFSKILFCFETSGGLHCSLCGLGSWSYSAKLCQSSSQYAFSWKAASTSFKGARGTQRTEFITSSSDWLQFGCSCLWLRWI